MIHTIKFRKYSFTLITFLLLSILLMVGCSTSKNISKEQTVTEQTKVEETGTISDKKEANYNTSEIENKVRIIEVYDTIGIVRREIEYVDTHKDAQYDYNNVYQEDYSKKGDTIKEVLTKEQEVILNKILSLDKETRDTIITSLVLVVLAIIGLIVLYYVRRRS